MVEMLLNLKKDKKGIIVKLVGGTSFKRKLRILGIREGKVIQNSTNFPFGGPIVIKIDGRQTTLGRDIAKQIFIEEK